MLAVGTDRRYLCVPPCSGCSELSPTGRSEPLEKQLRSPWILSRTALVCHSSKRVDRMATFRTWLLIREYNSLDRTSKEALLRTDSNGRRSNHSSS